MILNDLFRLTEKKTTWKKEVVAGLATWITMVYIATVNPHMLGDAGMDFGAVFVATCLAAAFGSIIMGAYANLPIALAPGMGLNAFFVYSIVIGMGISWNQALGAVFWSGILFLLLSLTKIRERIVESIPDSVKTGIAIGIGLFLAVIGLSNAGVIVKGEGTLTQLGDIHSWSVILSSVGFLVIVTLYTLKKLWAVIFGIFAVAVAGWFLDPTITFPSTIASMPPSLEPTFFKLDILVPLDVAFITVVISLLFVDLFDTSGTLVAVARRGGLEDKDGKIQNLGEAMKADSAATVLGALMGTSTTTSYIESNAGIASGGKTGLTAAVVAILFVATLFFEPLAKAIPTYATAPALVFVAVLLIGTLSRFSQWEDFSESAPLVITAIMMPLSFSIADGLAVGILTHTLVRVLSGRWSEVHPIMAGLSAVFLGRFVFLFGV